MAASKREPASVENYRSHIAESLFYIEGKQMSLANYPMHRAIYDGHYQRLLLKCGRQVAKSVSIAGFMIAETIGQPHFKTFYVSPSQEQTRKFSHTRIAKILSYSPELRKNFIGPESIDNVLLRLLRNGSEMAFTYALDDPDRARGYSADRCCFDANVEVMTTTGWKLVRDISYTDLIADVNAIGEIEWSAPTDLIRKSHTGTMVTFNHRKMSLRVTGDHKMWVNWAVKTSPSYKQDDRYEFATATSLADTARMGFKMTNRCHLANTSPTTIDLPGAAYGYSVSRQTLSVPAIPFASFMGWYLSEGCLQWRDYSEGRRAKSVTITQNENRHSETIERCLVDCGFQFSKQQHVNTAGNLANVYNVSHVQLGAYCEPMGLCRDKFIPEIFFRSSVLLESLLKALYLGDASYHDGDAWDQGTLRTRSKRLAEDAHRAWALLGRAASIHVREMAPRPGAPVEPLYEVQAYNRDYSIFWRHEFATKNRVMKTDVENEEVYCFTVKNHRPLVRGGWGQVPVIAGQCFDEIQDMLYEPVVPVIEACMSNSNYGYSVYAGTPKTMENSIEYLWSTSSQTEWCMKCDACNKSTYIVSPKALGTLGPVCLGCGKYLNTRNGRWVDMQPGAKVKGFHIPQAIMPENVPAAWNTSDAFYAKSCERWQRLMDQQESWGEVKFLNECLGVSTSTGSRLLTKEILEGLCDPKLEMERLPTEKARLGIKRVVAGVDWSGGGGEVKGSEGLLKSRTVLHIWGEQADGRLRTLFYKIFPNGHMVGWIDEIVLLCQAWGVQMICGDAGEGALANAMLRDKLGDHKVIQARYMALSSPIQWNAPTLTYHCDRTTMIDNFATFLIHKQAVYAKIPKMQPAMNDILNVYEETTLQGRKVWRHSPTQPDDALHAQLFGWIAWRVLTQNMSFY